jgi:UDPglucose--hexose-1-phosphate uridylyltransferase
MSRTLSLVPSERAPPVADDQGECRYCAGNESKTPIAELVLFDKFGGIVKSSDSEDERQSDWVARVFKSSKPLVFEDPRAGFSDEPLLGEPAQGSHYVVVTSPNHEEAFHSATVNQISNGLIAMQEQVKSLYQGRGISYVAAYSNYHPGKGTSAHPHIDLVSLGKVPPIVDAELEATDTVFDELGICPVCRVVNVESGGPRQVIASEGYVAFVPWAPTHEMEFWIVPKKHQRSFLKLTQNQIKDLAMMLRCTLGGFAKEVGPEYGISFHMAPERKQQSQYHWHIEVHPPSREFNALESGFGVYVMPASPEQSGERLGRAARREMAEVLGVR